MKKEIKIRLIVINIVLLFLVIGLGGYIVYDKVFATDNENNGIVNNETQDIVKNDISADELYSNYLKKLKTNLTKTYTENDGEGNISGDLFKYNFTLNKEGILSMSIKENTYEVSNKVLEMFLVDTGNGGYKNLYFIKEDGTLNYFCADCVTDGNFDIKKSEHKNIVNVMNSSFGVTTSGANSPVFIDIEGNVYK